jgi:hypothetical protein
MPIMSLRWSPVLFALSLCGVLPSGAAAQHVVEGRVVGASDGMPIEDVTIRAVGEDLVVGTDSTGFFRFEVPDDRPGVALSVEVIGYRRFERTWILPLAEPIRIGLQRDAVQLQGIDVEVDRPRMSLPEILEFRVRSIQNGIPRSAGSAELRAFEHQEADVWDFLPAMTVAIGAGCEECIMANGRFEPDFIVDDRKVEYDEFRSYRVGEICRVDVVTIPIVGSPTERGFVMAYTCAFLREVATGERRLPILLSDMWDRGE